MSSREALSSVGSQDDTHRAACRECIVASNFPSYQETPGSSTEVSGPFEVRLFYLMVQDDEHNECVAPNTSLH